MYAQNSCLILTLKLIALEDGAFGRTSSHERETLISGISALIKKESPENSLIPLHMGRYGCL